MRERQKYGGMKVTQLCRMRMAAHIPDVSYTLARSNFFIPPTIYIRFFGCEQLCLSTENRNYRYRCFSAVAPDNASDSYCVLLNFMVYVFLTSSFLLSML
jgi:hypothetical protein